MSASDNLKAMESVQSHLEREGFGLGFDPTILIQLLPLLLSLFQNCKKPAPTPAPQPTSSAASANAWKTANDARAFAEEHFDADNATYTRSVLSRGASDLMRRRKRDGEKIKRAEAIKVVSANLDEAREGDLESNALAIDAAE